jgi:predicted NBD/HSP70 family sugar kinase
MTQILRPERPTGEGDGRGPILGLDLGGSKIATLVASEAGALTQHVIPTDGRPVEQQLIDAGRAALTAAGVLDGELRAVGVAAPGHVDAATGTLRMAVNLNARELPLARLLAAELGAACFVEHDARAAAAWLASVDRAARHLAYVSVGTGISAGVVSDGHPVHGAHGLAGEIGQDLGFRRCGLRGTVISSRARTTCSICGCRSRMYSARRWRQSSCGSGSRLPSTAISTALSRTWAW